MTAARGSYRARLLDRPGIESNGLDGHVCPVCGRYANNLHHVVPKGMGGTGAAVERRIPKVLLCGSGTTGCHGAVHRKRLHLNYSGGRWLHWWSPTPMDDEVAWEVAQAQYAPLPYLDRAETIGGKR